MVDASENVETSEIEIS